MDDVCLFLSQYEAEFPLPRVPDGLLGKYRIQSCLKSSERSQVYLLSGAEDGAICVLKAAPAAAMPQLMREYRLLFRLHDSAFPHPIACFSEGEHAYLLREFIPGQPLTDCVENSDKLAPYKAADIACKACAAVEKLHSLTPPVIHRDIKPQNFILAQDGTLHLIDLDAVQEYSPEKMLDTVVMGTVATAAPEQFGFQRCDPRTDVYGIGKLLHFMLTGSYEEKARLPGFHAYGLQRIIRKCLQFDPNRRYGSVVRLQKALNAYRFRWRRRLLALMAVLVLFCAALAVYQGREAIAGYAAALISQPGQEMHQFASPLVEQAVRLQLDKPSGGISKAELAGINELYLCGETAYASWTDVDTFGNGLFLRGTPYEKYGMSQDLSDLADMPNLRKLALYRLSLSGLEPLVHLPLTHLAVGGNRITDLSPLGNLPMLQELDVSDNPVSDLSVLEKLPLLKSLGIGATQVKTLAPLANIQLESLTLYDLPEDVDFTALSSITSLKEVGARFLPQQAVDLLLRHSAYQSIILFYCGVDSLKPFASMPELSYLNLVGNELQNLDGIGDLKHLRSLDIDRNKVTRIDAMASHPSLQYLVLANNPIEDFSCLNTIATLVSITASKDQETLLKGLDFPPSLQVGYREYTIPIKQ